ncbi:MAG: DUF2807 domain-containing protein [Candidatus Cloacimonetes bacterium]|nr:DUF2807 domain-containing protein [Candidatus Cloacimonadota bacterium]
MRKSFIVVLLCLLAGCSLHKIAFQNDNIMAELDLTTLTNLTADFAEEKVIEFETFSNLILEGDFIVIFRQSEVESIVVKSRKKNTLKYIRHNYEENTLRIYRKNKFFNWGLTWLASENLDVVLKDVNNIPMIQIYITAPDVETITLKKEAKLLMSSVSIENIADMITLHKERNLRLPNVVLDKLTLNVNKSSSANLLNIELNELNINTSGHDTEMEIHLSGKVDQLAVTKKCSGTIYGNDLSAQFAKIRTSNGDIHIHSVNSLEAHISSLGRIRVYNEPEIVNITGKANRVRFN